VSAIIDWECFLACPVCASLKGEPCLSLRGLLAGSGPVEVALGVPHSSRPASKAAGRG
jgi:hypothetical protein